MNTEIAVAIISVTGAIFVAIISASLPYLFKRLSETDKRVEVNEKTLNDLIAYKPGAIAYGYLVNIKNRDYVTYNDQDEDKKRCLNLLLDDGYLQPALGVSNIHFSREYDGKKLYEIASLTPISEELIRLREVLSKNRDT